MKCRDTDVYWHVHKCHSLTWNSRSYEEFQTPPLLLDWINLRLLFAQDNTFNTSEDELYKEHNIQGCCLLINSHFVWHLTNLFHESWIGRGVKLLKILARSEIIEEPHLQACRAVVWAVIVLLRRSPLATWASAGTGGSAPSGRRCSCAPRKLSDVSRVWRITTNDWRRKRRQELEARPRSDRRSLTTMPVCIVVLPRQWQQAEE